MKTKKKLICTLMASIMLMSSISYCYADVKNVLPNEDIAIKNVKTEETANPEVKDIMKSIESKQYKEEHMNAEEEKVFNDLIQNSIKNTADLELNSENIEAVKMLLRDDISVINDGETSFVMYRASAKIARKPRIRIKNSHAAAVFNAIISVAAGIGTGAAGTVAINALIRKLGKAGAKNFLKQQVARKIKNRLIAWGMSKYAGYIDAVLGGIVYNLIDPGTAIAKEIDKRDGWGRNGYIEI